MNIKCPTRSAVVILALVGVRVGAEELSFDNPQTRSAAEDHRANAKLYVLNSQSDDAAIIGIPAHEVIGRIKVGANPHGIAISSAQDRLFVSAESDNLIKVIDTASDELLTEIRVGPRPNEIAATPDGRLVYVPSLLSGTYEVVDVAQGTIVAKIKTGGLPHNVVCSADGKHMYLAPLGAPHKIFVVETAAHRIVGEIPLASAPRPIAVSRDERRLYVERDGLVGFELIDVPGRRVLHTVRLDLTPEEQTVTSRAHGIGLTPDQSELWVCDVNHELVAVFDLGAEPPRQIARIATKSPPYWLTFSPDGAYAYVSCAESGEVQVIDVATRKELKRIAVGKGPKRLMAITTAQF